MNKWMKTYPNLSMVIGGEEGGVCIGPAILDNPKFPPQWEPGSEPKPGLNKYKLLLNIKKFVKNEQKNDK